MKLIDKSALVEEIKRLLAFYLKEIEDNKEDPWAMDIAKRDILQEILSFLNTLEVKEVNEVPATVMVNKYGNRFISSWPGLKEYDDFNKGEEIKIVIPKK